jgi:toxin secretion/phage lysis holin
MEIAITAFFTTIALWFGNFAIAFLILVICNIADYVSRIVVNKITGVQISSSIGFKGIFKKVAMWLLVFVGFMIDCMITYATGLINFSIPFHFFFATAVASWLVFNEIISILENLSDGGASIPKFLLNIPRSLKEQIETKADIPITNGGNKNGNS